jgi:hypothetical protein
MHRQFHACCAVLLGSRVINNQGAWMKACKLEVERSGVVKTYSCLTVLCCNFNIYKISANSGMSLQLSGCA